MNWSRQRAHHIGLGYRSSIDHTLEGTISIPGTSPSRQHQRLGIKAGVTLPEIVTLSLRHECRPRS